jgi:hypothetical protein
MIMAEGARNGSGGEAAAGVPDGAEASNVVTLQRHAPGEASHESVDEAQLVEEFNPDSQEPARGKNKRSKE